MGIDTKAWMDGGSKVPLDHWGQKCSTMLCDYQTLSEELQMMTFKELKCKGPSFSLE